MQTSTKTVFATIFIALCLFGCGAQPKVAQPVEETINRRWGNGNPSLVLEYYTLGDYDSYVRKNYAKSGILKTEETVKDNWLHGPTIHYYNNGRIQLKEEFVEDIKHGPIKEWYKSGALKSEGEYNNGAMVRYTRYHPNGQLLLKAPLNAQGKLEGRSTEYFDNGVISREGDYINNLKEGEWKIYRNDGSLQGIEVYQQGQMIDLKDAS